MNITMSVNELRDNIQSGRRLTLLACKWVPGENASYGEFRKGHIPTAVFMDPETYLAGVPSSQSGRNPLPTLEALRRGFQQCGINGTHRVVVYDGGKGVLAGRAWWILTWAGVDNVAIVDGQMPAWDAAGFDEVVGPGNFPQTNTIDPEPGHLPVATMEDVRETNKILVDVREPSRFAGKKEFLDVRAGHIPGAVNLPLDELLHTDRTFQSKANIRRAFDLIGVDNPEDAIIYSGSGLHSSLAIAAMHHAGLLGAANYVAGWSQWCATKSNPIDISL